MSNNNQNRAKGLVGFLVALVLLAFVILAGQTNILGSVSSQLKQELANIFSRGTGDASVVIAKILAMTTEASPWSSPRSWPPSPSWP